MSEFCEHLYSKEPDGYVNLTIFDENKIIEIKNSKYNGLAEIIEENLDKKDVFITPNTFYIPYRNSDNIRHFRAFYIDIDNIKNDQLATAYEIFNMADNEEIPKPSMIVDSGRGLHIYWRIENAPYQALHSWQEIEDFLYYKLKKFGADRKATDSARLLRLPQTVNSRSNTTARILYINNNLEYSMYDIKEKYLLKFTKREIHHAKKSNPKLIKNIFFNSYSLHFTRAKDLVKLCEIREWNVEGYRNAIIHCYAYWQGIYQRDSEELRKSVEILNNRFKKPLRNNEINSILKCVPKAIDKYIKYTQGIASGERKRVSKGMKDKGGYWYKNSTLIEMLDIKIHEQEQLETIISKDIKYKRNNYRRTPRNSNGLTAKQQELEDLKVKIKEMIDKDNDINYICKNLKISRAKYYRIIEKM